MHNKYHGHSNALSAFSGAFLVLLAVTSFAAESAKEDEVDAETHCLALNIYWEARSEFLEAQRAVAFTVLNRVRHSDFPGSICAVVKEGGESGACQFSWWCDRLADNPTEESAWATAKSVAKRVRSELHEDPTSGALFCHHKSIMPHWSHEMVEVTTIGDHVFYKRR